MRRQKLHNEPHTLQYRSSALDQAHQGVTIVAPDPWGRLFVCGRDRVTHRAAGRSTGGAQGCERCQGPRRSGVARGVHSCHEGRPLVVQHGGRSGRRYGGWHGHGSRRTHRVGGEPAQDIGEAPGRGQGHGHDSGAAHPPTLWRGRRVHVSVLVKPCQAAEGSSWASASKCSSTRGCTDAGPILPGDPLCARDGRTASADVRPRSLRSRSPQGGRGRAAGRSRAGSPPGLDGGYEHRAHGMEARRRASNGRVLLPLPFRRRRRWRWRWRWQERHTR